MTDLLTIGTVPPSNRKPILFVSLVLALMIGALFISKDYLLDRFVEPGPIPPTFNMPKQRESVLSPTHVSIVDPVVIPNTHTTDLPENVAIPSKVADSLIADSSLRVFKMTVNAGKFWPDTISVKQNDSVRITISAKDHDYDFTQPDMGFKLAIPQGSSRNLDFSPSTPGKFTFYCEKCGGLRSEAVGYIIVASQD